MMKHICCFYWIGIFLFAQACSSRDDSPPVKGQIAFNGTLTQLSGLATVDECPNGGVTLEHGVDTNADGALSPGEVLTTYVVCHGRDGKDADVSDLRLEIDALKSAVDLNTAKVGLTGEQAEAIEENSTTLGNIGEHPAFDGWDKTAADDFDSKYSSLEDTPDFTNWDKDNSDDFDGSYNSLTGTPSIIGPEHLNDFNELGSHISVLAEDIYTDYDSNFVWEDPQTVKFVKVLDTEGWDKDTDDDFNAAYTSLTGKPATITQAQADAILANTSKVGFPGFGNEAGKALEGDFVESDPIASGVVSVTEDWVTNQNYATASDVSENTTSIAQNADVMTLFYPPGMVAVPGGPYIYQDGPANLPSFLIDIYQVTAAEYEECVSAGGCIYGSLGTEWLYETHNTYQNEKDNHPINFVNWEEALTYCAWREKRLPTEQEWEKAARGTDGRNFPWGNSITSNNANYDDHVGQTTQVGYYDGINSNTEDSPSPYGVYDMAGNVSEWTDSWWDDNLYRVVRGGSFVDDSGEVRTFPRAIYNPAFRYYFIGFRCVK